MEHQAALNLFWQENWFTNLSFKQLNCNRVMKIVRKNTERWRVVFSALASCAISQSLHQICPMSNIPALSENSQRECWPSKYLYVMVVFLSACFFVFIFLYRRCNYVIHRTTLKSTYCPQSLLNVMLK